VDERETLLHEIARERAVLERLERDVQQARARLRDLEASLDRGSASTAADGSPATSAEKVALFRRLFRGRDDVYPRYWENVRTDRRGYAPACANEWVRGVCEKPRVKCGDCPRQDFIPVGTVVQYAGRLSRLHPRKTEVRIYDYVDQRVPLLARMFEKRLRGYRLLGYGVPKDTDRI
jgi:hypothetical protein